MTPATVEYGAWPSPLSAADVAGSTLRLYDVAVDGEDAYWIEGRPAENGRCVIMRHDRNGTHELLPAPFTARTSVHEYGGGAFAVHDGTVYFSDGRQGQVFRAHRGATPEAVTAVDPALRFADFCVDPARGRLIAVAEDHSGDTVINSLVAIDIATGAVAQVASGSDFFSSPRLSPDATQLAWLTWDFPEMPWDGTELWLADVAGDGSVGTPRRITGGESESVMQPRWSPDGVLHFVTDITGWWNVYRVDGDGIVNVAPMERECARPHWNFGLASYAFLGTDSLAICSAANGTWQLHLVDRESGATTRLDVPWTEMGARLHSLGDRLVLAAGSPVATMALHLVGRDGGVETFWRSSDSVLGSAWVSTCEAIRFPTPDGAIGHGLLYRPTNPEFTAPHGTAPPLLVLAHGGPTAAAATSLALDIQYFTTRGFMVCDVNYGGSTGYGRPYRERLRGQSGCVDVDDCIAAAKYLAAQGLCNGERMCISGGSAGGYIVLCALVFEPDVFAAATSYYGVTDIESLTTDDHKFESRYFDSLIGPVETHRSLYHNRSPIHFVSRIRTPLLVLQGEDDTIVPRAQAEAIVAELRENSVLHAYIAFAGEQHGFRKAESIKRSLEAELGFYGQVLGFKPDGDLPTVGLQGATTPG